MSWERKIERKQRKRILERDGHKCVVCWRKHQLAIHHHHDFSGKIPTRRDSMVYNQPYINPRDCDLATLCKTCHGKIQLCDKGSPLYHLVTDYLAQTVEKQP